MELRHLRYFLAVAEELNFTRAAARVGIGQPPLSQQIRSLEGELGTPLFRRTPTGAQLTEAGKAFLPEARAILERAEHAAEAARRAGRGESGSIRIGFTASAAYLETVPRSIRLFTRSYPDIQTMLVEAGTSPLLEQIREERLDAAFVRLGRHDPEGVSTLTLGSEGMSVVVPEGHPLGKAKSIALGALAGERMLLFPRSAGPGLHDEIIAACWLAGFEPSFGQEAPQFSSAINLVAAGMGISLVPRSMARLHVRGVRYLSMPKGSPTIRLALATRGAAHTRVVDHFVASVRRVCDV
jgi:DNA-binding transcriptional LysR family regulator